MPNGSDKNYYRLKATIAGFRARYGEWPGRVRVWPDYLQTLYAMLPAGGWSRLVRKLDLVAADPEAQPVPFVAEGAAGERFEIYEEMSAEALQEVEAEVEEWYDHDIGPTEWADF